MIEINIRLDFSSDNVFPDGNKLGYVGEHNATTLTVTPPPEMTANENIAFYCLAFEVGDDFIRKIVRSALIPKAATFEVKLWKQVTISENPRIQLEAYDSDNSLLIKTNYVDAVLSPSLKGVQSTTDTNGQSLAGTVAANTAKLADFSTDENGNLTYEGQKIGGATLKSKYYANDWENGLIGFDLTGADTFFGFFEPLPDNALVYDFSVEFNGKTYMSSELYSKSLISNTSTLNVFGKPEFNSDYGIYLAARTGNDLEGTLYGEISADTGIVTGFTIYYLEV